MSKSNIVRLSPTEIPKQWFNYVPSLPKPLPEIKNVGGKSQREIMVSIRPKTLVEQNNFKDSWIDIPNDVIELLVRVGRPTDLHRATALEKYLDTPAKIFLKREDQLTSGSFKLNSALPQAYYCKQEQFSKIITETGAGQWGMSISLAARLFDMTCDIYMPRCSFDQKPYRRYFMEILNSNILPSPNINTDIGRELLKNESDHPGSLGTAISDAIEATFKNKNGAAYLSGSNHTHVLIHQSIIGLEVQKQMKIAGEQPDELIACVSGGGNFGGLVLPYLDEKLAKNNIRFIGAESTAAPRLTKGRYDYEQSDPAGYTPSIKSYTMGSNFIPAPIHVGGLRQHNGSPTIGLLRNLNLMDAEAYSEKEAFEVAQLFLSLEGILIAPESAHAIASVIKSAKEAKKTGKKKNVVCVISGNGFLDLEGFNKVLSSD